MKTKQSLTKPKIKFSHKYPKLWGQMTAMLISTRLLSAEIVQDNNELLQYETKYCDNSPDGGVAYGYYKLPSDGYLIQLIFIGDHEIPFCTLRPFNSGKLGYYSSHVGEIFDIVISKEESCI